MIGTSHHERREVPIVDHGGHYRIEDRNITGSNILFFAVFTFGAILSAIPRFLFSTCAGVFFPKAPASAISAFNFPKSHTYVER